PRKALLAAMINTVPKAASAIKSAPAQAPTAADDHRVAAVFNPRMLLPALSLIMAPAPRKPTPETTDAAIRTAPSEPAARMAKSTKIAAPTATRTLVRNPAT